jgi:glycosyl transferase, family 25
MLPVKVISLERSVERRAEFRRYNSHLGYEFVDAIDGATLHPDVISRLGLFKPGLSYKAGAYGVALSHYRLWDETVHTGRPLTVAEDDAIFRLDFARTHTALLAGLPADWDLVLWGWNLDSVLAMQIMPGVSSTMYFDYLQLLEKVEEFQNGVGHPQLFRLDKCFGLPAYSVSPQGARKLIAQCFPLDGFTLTVPLIGNVPNFGLDVATCRIYAAINSFVSFPQLAMTKNDRLASTIQNSPYLSG